MYQRPRKAIFPVAGIGSRFFPATKAMPKEMLPVVDKPLIQYAVEEAWAAGIKTLIFITGKGKSAIEDHFDRSRELERWLQERKKFTELEAILRINRENSTMVYLRQSEPLGLGHAVGCARHLIGDEPCAVILPDDLFLAGKPCMEQMCDAYEQCGGNLVAVMQVPMRHVSRYGIIDPGERSANLLKIRQFVEKPSTKQAPSNWAAVGRYILQPQIFPLLAKNQPGSGGEIQLTDAMSALIGKTPFHGYCFHGARFDCGEKTEYLMAQIAFAMRRHELADPLREFLQKTMQNLTNQANDPAQPDRKEPIVS